LLMFGPEISFYFIEVYYCFIYNCQAWCIIHQWAATSRGVWLHGLSSAVACTVFYCQWHLYQPTSCHRQTEAQVPACHWRIDLPAGFVHFQAHRASFWSRCHISKLFFDGKQHRVTSESSAGNIWRWSCY
jgi:hypothetical protein